MWVRSFARHCLSWLCIAAVSTKWEKTFRAGCEPYGQTEQQVLPLMLARVLNYFSLGSHVGWLAANCSVGRMLVHRLLALVTKRACPRAFVPITKGVITRSERSERVCLHNAHANSCRNMSPASWRGNGARRVTHRRRRASSRVGGSLGQG